MFVELFSFKKILPYIYKGMNGTFDPWREQFETELISF